MISGTQRRGYKIRKAGLLNNCCGCSKLWLSGAAPSFSRSLAAIHAPTPQHPTPTRQGRVPSYTHWYFHAQSLTAPQTAGCSPHEGLPSKTVPGVQRDAAPASARIDMYNNKTYFSTLSWAKDPAQCQPKPADSMHLWASIRKDIYAPYPQSPASHFDCRKHFPSFLKVLSFLCLYTKFNTKGWEHCLQEAFLPLYPRKS